MLALALLYLLAVAAMQAVTFVYSYLAATGAQGALSGLRTRLFAHLQRLPTGYFDRVPLGDVISRCTADVDTLDTVFSSGVALLLANLVRLVTIAVAMVALSPLPEPGRGRDRRPAAGGDPSPAGARATRGARDPRGGRRDQHAAFRRI